MLGMETHLEQPIPVSRAARLLRVPVGWLKTECLEGRVPCLQAGRAILVVLPAVAAALAARAKEGGYK